MEQSADNELLIKRHAKECFDLCLNLIDKDELLEAIDALEKAISLQPNNELFAEFSLYLKEVQSLSTKDPCERPQTSSTQSSYPPKESNSKTQRETKVPSINGSEKHTSCNDDKIPRGKCSHCPNIATKRNMSSNAFSDKEKTKHFEPLFDNEKEEEQNSSSDCEKQHWFPNPAKYNVEGFDIDARFLEEVCKQRESSDGWDTYMKLLSDKSQDEDDTSDEIDDIHDELNVENIGSINDLSTHDTNHSSDPISPAKPCERKDHSSKEDEEEKPSAKSSTCEENKSSENSSSHPEDTGKASNDGDKERLYFVNGKGCYGVPPSPGATASSTPTKSTPASSKTKLDPSENDFYANLRFHFKVYDSKADFMNRNKEAASEEAGSTHKPDAEEKLSSVKKEEKDKETGATGLGRDTPHVAKGKHNSGSSNTSNSRTMFNEQQGKDRNQKMGNSSERKSKKGNKNAPEDNSQQTKAKPRLNKKHKHRVSEGARENKQPAGKEKATRTTKEEKNKKKFSNSSESGGTNHWSFRAAKKFGGGLLWIAYYTILILLVVIIFTGQCLYSILKFLVETVTSWRFSILVVNKLSHWKGVVLVCLIGAFYSCKTRCIRWYYGIKTSGFKRFFFGPERPAQTYNLPSSGEDAIQQLLMKRNSDPYSILGVPKDASDDDIRKQYRKIAVLVHPDKNSHLRSAEAFRVLSGAYDVIGDPEKRLEFDNEVRRREAFQRSQSQNPTRDFSDPTDVFAEFLRQMEEMRESLSCDVCERRHRRILTDRDVIHARRCYQCNRMHLAKEGDFWKESAYMGFGRSKFYACMEGRIYDISEWGHCQERNGFTLPSDTHRVLGRISTRPRQPHPPTSRLEEELWRELFGQSDRYDGNYGNQANKNRQPRSRRKKRR